MNNHRNNSSQNIVKLDNKIHTTFESKTIEA